MSFLLRAVRRLVVGDARELARKSQREAWIAAEADLHRFTRELRIVPGVPSLVLGHVGLRDGQRRLVGLRLSGLLDACGIAINGSSGSGKTTIAVDTIDQALAYPNVRMLAVDPKGDFERAFREVRFPLRALASGEEFSSRVRYVRPFVPGPAPPLRFTAAEEGIPIEVQSRSLGTALAEAMGVELTLPALHAFSNLARVAIEQRAPLTAIVGWIARPETFARAARGLQDAALRQYATVEFPREHRGMLRSLRVRLESVLLLPSVRAALEAPTCMSFPQSLEEHHLLIDLSNPPAGEEAAVRMLGGPIIGRLTRSILRRPVSSPSPHVLLALDELQEVLSHYETASFARLAALGRARRVSLVCINQQRVQLGAKLSEVLRTNTSAELIFRCSAADAEALSHVLPIPENCKRPTEERRALVRRMVSLRRRSFLLWNKSGVVPSHFVQARKVDADALERAAAAVPEDVRRGLGRWPDPTRGVPERVHEPTRESSMWSMAHDGERPSDSVSDFPSLG